MVASMKNEERTWRGKVGGMWKEIGRLQFDYLVSQGLRPEHRLLDVGCGCLRGGIHFVSYLADGHYYGIDKDEYLLVSARDVELPEAGLAHRQVHLLCRDDFDFARFGARFDYALAQSVFTHLPWNSILRCLVEMQAVTRSSPGMSTHSVVPPFRQRSSTLCVPSVDRCSVTTSDCMTT